MARFIPISPQSGQAPALAPAGVLAAPAQGLASLLDDNFGGAGGAPGGPVGSTGATNSGPGTPGVGPTDGTAVGTGNMSLGQTAAAFGNGMLGGLPGNISNAVNNPGDMTVSQGLSMAAQAASLIGTIANPSPMGAAKLGLQGLIGVANGAQNSVGPSRGQTFGEAASQMRSDLSNLFGLTAAPPALPNININDPSLKGLTDFSVPPDLELTGNVPTAPTNPTIPDDATTPGLGLPDGPTGNDGGTGNANGEAGGDSGGVGGVWEHGGEVHGPGGIDNVPGRLTDEEFVIDRDSALRFPGLVRAVNAWEPGDPEPRGLMSLLRRGRQ